MSCVSLSNGKWIATCTSCHKTVGMWLYNQKQQRLKWKDLRIFNDETHVQVYVDGVGANKGIESRWSQGFGLNELDV